jgi:hypothetical protein
MTWGVASLPFAPAQVGVSEISARLVAGAHGYFGAPVLHIEPLGAVPRVFSTVLRLRVQTAGASIVVFAKRFRPRDGEHDDGLRGRVVREYEQTLLAYEGLRHAPGLGAVRPVAVFPELHVLVTEEVHGRTLRRLLARGAHLLASRRSVNHLIQVHERVGHWVREYESLERHEGPVSIAKVRAYVQTRIEGLCTTQGDVFSAGDCDLWASAFDRFESQLTSADLRPVRLHADFNPENIVVDNGRIIAIDFSEAQRGLRYADLLHLYLHIERLKHGIRFSPSVGGELQRALLRGYGEPEMDRTPLFHINILQQAAAYLSGDQGPRWARLAPTSSRRRKRRLTFRMLERLSVLDVAHPSRRTEERT